MKVLPSSETVPAIRTDFSDEQSWRDVRDALEIPSSAGFVANLNCIDDPAYRDLSAEQVLSVVPPESAWPCAALIDRTTLSDPEHPVLVVDLWDEPGRTLRVIPSALWAIENNLSVGNMAFAEFADAADADGVFRTW